MGTSIHWHGIHQVGTPYMDGTAGMTQCQLQPLATQNFTFEAYPAGTFFWHGHYGKQDKKLLYSISCLYSSSNLFTPLQINTGMSEADGISGPLIVHPKKPPTYEYDEDVVVFLQDFYSVTAEQQQVGLMSFPFVWVVSVFILLRGRHIVLNYFYQN